jgi:mannosyltransferase OCH1-like enzyme
MPSLFEEFGETWRKHHPAWKMCLWTEAELPTLVNQRLFDAASSICPGFEGQFQSDLARYEILHRYGGVYIDVDFECRRAIDPLLEGVSSFCAWEIQDSVANNAIMGAVPQHPLLFDLVAGLPDRITRRAGSRPAQLTGPHYLTSVLRRHPEIPIFDQKLFFPYGCKELDRAHEAFPEAYAVHHWNNQRRLRRRPLCTL